MNSKQQDQNTSDVSHFQFQDKQANKYGKRTGLYFGQADPKRMKNGFARWSDYVNYDSDEISLIRQEDNTVLFIPLVSDAEDQVEEVVHPISAPIQIQSNKNEVKNGVKISRKSERELKNDSQKDRETNIYKQQSNPQSTGGIINKGSHFIDLAISGIKSQIKHDSSPFPVDNISDVKKRDSVNTARTSQRFLLQLLQNDKAKERQKDRKEQPMVIQKKGKLNQREKQIIIKKKEQVVVTQKSKISDRNRITDRGSRPKEELMVIEKVEKLQRQRSGIYRQSQQVEEDRENKPKSKRVTINDKGKIKLPCDSISGDYEYVLPPQLRQYQTSGKKRLREEVIEEEEEEDKQEEPMEIVQPPVQYNKPLQNKAQQGAPSDEQQQKEEKIVIKNTKRRRPIRIVSPKQKIVPPKGQKRTKSNNQKSKTSTRQRKQSSLGGQSKQKINNIGGKKMQKQNNLQKVVSDQTNMVKNEQPKKKRKVNSEIGVVALRDEDNSRPKRNRVHVLKYWQNQRMIYSKQGKPIGLSVFTVQILFQMIGCTKPEGFILEKAHPFALEVQRKLRVPIKPKQKVDFNGLNLLVMRKFFGEDNLEYKHLQIEGKDGYKGFIKYVNVQVNGLSNYSIEKPIVIKQEQFFTIQNNHQTRSFQLLFTLKDENGGDK